MERQGGSSDHQNEPPQQPEASSSGSTEKSSSTDQNETTTGQKTTNTESNVPPPNSFSFKHFLKDSGNSSTASASVRPQASSSVPSLGGARPKIPHYSLLNGGNESLPRMKRSPKFPSFDSHASLAEYSEEVQPNFVQRSHSNYEVESPLLLGDDRRSPADVRPQPSAATSNRNNGEFSAALPDFVKDHLVLEQWFQSNFQSNSSGGLCSNSTSPPPSSSSQQPPVLGLDNSEPTLRPSNRPLGDNMPFDLMFNSTVASSSPTSFRRNNSPTMPLDLPPYDRSLDMPHRRFSYNRSMASSDLPLDLTETRSGNSGSSSHSNLQRHFRGDHDSLDNDAPPQVQADMIQTLPDFLSDGPIHSSGRLADVAQDLPTLDSPEENSSNIISRLRLENDRLRHELDETRRQLSDQSRQKSELERTCRNSEIQRNGALLEKNKLLQKITQMTVSFGLLSFMWNFQINL